MPIRITASAGGGDDFGSPFVGPIDNTASIAVPLGVLTNKEIDPKGYLKAGIPLSAAGALVGTGVAVYGVTVEAVKVAADNAAATIAALGTIWVAVATICQVNKAQAESILERSYTGFETAGFALAGSKCVLLA
jgi:hypothetical protein